MIGFTSINVLAGVCLETNQNNPIQTKQNQYKNFKTNHRDPLVMLWLRFQYQVSIHLILVKKLDRNYNTMTVIKQRQIIVCNPLNFMSLAYVFFKQEWLGFHHPLFFPNCEPHILRWLLHSFYFRKAKIY